MASTTFTDKVTLVPADWANDVNTLTYAIFGGAQTKTQALAALGLSWADQNNLQPVITGGSIDNTPIGQNTPAAGKFSALQVTAQGTGNSDVVTVAYLNTRLTTLSNTLGTMSTQDANDVAITGGAIDGAVIGANTPVAATFTKVTVSVAPTASTDLANKQYVDSAIAASIPTLGTLATQNANAVAITGGTIDGVTIGGTTPANGSFVSVVGNTFTGPDGVLALDGSVLGYASYGAVLASLVSSPNAGVLLPSTGEFHVQQNAVDRFVINAQGRVLIGATDDHVNQLQVVGGIAVDTITLSGAITAAGQATTKTYVDAAQTAAQTYADTAITAAINALGSMAHQNAGTVAITGGALDAVSIGVTTPASHGIFAAGQVIAAPVNAQDLVNKEYVDDSIAALPTFGTMAAQNADAIVVTGGTMDDVVIGAVTPATAFFLRAGAYAVVGPSGTVTLDGSLSNYFSYGVVLDGSASGPNIAVRLGTTGAFHVRSSTDADMLLVDPSGRLIVNTANDSANYLQVSGGARIDSIVLSSPITQSTQAATKAYVDTTVATFAATVAGQIATAIAALGTMSQQNANSVAITGGTINGTTIGNATPAAGSFTTLGATQTIGTSTGLILLNQANEALVLQAPSITKPSVQVWLATGGSFQVTNGTQMAMQSFATGRTLFGFGATDDGTSVLQVTGQAAVSGQLLIPQAPSNANSATNKAYVDAQIAAVSGSTVTPQYVQDAINTALVPYATQTYVNNAVAGFVTQSYVTAAINAALAPYATQTYVNNQITNALTSYATQTYVNNQIAAALTTYATQAYVTSQLASYASLANLAASTGAGLVGYGAGTVQSALDALTVTSYAPNLVYASPAIAPNGPPSFRSLVTADLPATIAATTLTTGSLATTGTVTFGGTAAVKLPVGSTAQQPASPSLGMTRYNSDVSSLEFYNGAWVQVLTSAGGAVGPLTVTGGISATGAVSAAGFSTSAPILNTAYVGHAPASGAVITVDTTKSHVFIDPAADIAALTVDLPVAQDGFQFTMTFSRAVTAITWTPSGSDTMGIEVPTAITAGSVVRFIYRADTTAWRLI